MCMYLLLNYEHCIVPSSVILPIHRMGIEVFFCEEEGENTQIKTNEPDIFIQFQGNLYNYDSAEIARMYKKYGFDYMIRMLRGDFVFFLLDYNSKESYSKLWIGVSSSEYCTFNNENGHYIFSTSSSFSLPSSFSSSSSSSSSEQHPTSSYSEFQLHNKVSAQWQCITYGHPYWQPPQPSICCNMDMDIYLQSIINKQCNYVYKQGIYAFVCCPSLILFVRNWILSLRRENNETKTNKTNEKEQEVEYLPMIRMMDSIRRTEVFALFSDIGNDLLSEEKEVPQQQQQQQQQQQIKYVDVHERHIRMSNKLKCQNYEKIKSELKQRHKNSYIMTPYLDTDYLCKLFENMSE